MAKDSVVRNNIWKWLILLLIAGISYYVCTPPVEKFRFGLDLKGGTSFTLGVDTDKLAQSIIAANRCFSASFPTLKWCMLRATKALSEPLFPLRSTVCVSTRCRVIS